MSMMTILKKAFGFSPETEEDDDYDSAVPQYVAATPSNRLTPQAAPASKPAAAPAAGSDSEADPDPSLPADLFDALIELFNNAQPDFVRKCLDTEAQRRYILDSLSASLRGRIDAAVQSSRNKWTEEKESLEKKIAELEGGDSVLAKLRQENRRLQLSVDRQKRALLDRINDLEAQVARQAEEKERFYSKKHTPGTEALAKANARIKQLEEEKSALEAAKNTLETEKKAIEAEKAVLETEKKTLEESKAATADSQADTEALAALQAELEQAKAEASRQSTLREQLEVKTAMSDSMINDLRNQAASARQELEKMQQEQESVMEQIQTQLDGFEDLKARKDAKISELQEANASLRRTIEANLYNQANSEMKLRTEIKELRAKLDAAATTAAVASPAPASASSAPQPAAEKSSRRRGRPKKVRIDSDLDNTEWFSSGKDDPDFGYHEPPRRPVNDNEAQLSLF